MKVSLGISGTDVNDRKLTLKAVRTVRNLSLPVQDVMNSNEICSKVFAEVE